MADVEVGNKTSATLVSPDGRKVAALLHREGRWRIIVITEPGSTRELETAGIAMGPPAWAPDGRRATAGAMRRFSNSAAWRVTLRIPRAVRTAASGGHAV